MKVVENQPHRIESTGYTSKVGIYAITATMSKTFLPSL